MSKQKKLKEKLLNVGASANIHFDDLCAFLNSCGFKERQKGSHRIFSRTDVAEIINVQPAADGKAKTYQVNQVRDLITKYNL